MAGIIGTIGCQTPYEKAAGVPEETAGAAEFNAALYERIPADQGRVFWVDSQASQVRFYLWRGGPLAAKGHNHVMVVEKMEGAVFLPDDMLDDTMRFEVVFPVDRIEVDPPALRQQLGGAFTTEISPEGIQGTRANMLGEKVLEADRFPTIGLRAARVYGELPRLALDTVITLHGFERRQWIPAAVTVTGDRLTAEGAFVIEQTDYGIQPFSTMGGVLYIQNPILVEFALIGRTR